MLNSKTKTQCKPFVLNLRRNCLKIAMIGSLRGRIITPRMLDICFNVYCAIARGYWDLCAQKPGCAFYEHKMNVFFIVLFISQLLVGVFFSCPSLTFGIVDLAIYTVIRSAESIPTCTFILNCFWSFENRFSLFPCINTGNISRCSMWVLTESTKFY